ISGRSLSRLLTLGVDRTSHRSLEVGIDSLQTSAPQGEELGSNPGKSSGKTSKNSRTIGTSSSRFSSDLSSAFLDVTCARLSDLELEANRSKFLKFTDLKLCVGTDLNLAAGTDLALAGSESGPFMPNKENYVPWSSRLLRYAKSRPNGKLIHNSILNGPYVRRMIPEPGDAERDVNVNETFHEQTDDELSEKELKQIEADDRAIQTILLCLPEDIYVAVDSCETAQEIWLRV
nr:hypothetical protein [Tanacetum cinerariifolium]